MQRERRRHKCTLPKRAGHAIQQAEKQHNIGDMEPHIDQVMRASVQAEQVIHDHPSQPRHGHPMVQ